MKRVVLTVMITLGFSLPREAGGQSSFNGWLASFHTFSTGKRSSLHLDVQARSTGAWEHIQAILVRPGWNLHLNKRAILTAGYAYIHNRRSIQGVTGYQPEHRIWQQFLYTHPLKQSSFTHRLRLEERLLPLTLIRSGELETGGFTPAGRLRYFIRNLWPITPKERFDRGFFLAWQNEIFVNVFDRHKVNGKFFDQNRFYAAMGYRLSPLADLELGYMNQYIQGSGSQQARNHILQLAAYIRR